MKRLYLIGAGAILLLAGLAAGAAYSLRPALIFGDTGANSETGSAIPAHSVKLEEATEAKKHGLDLVDQLGAVQDRIIRGDHDAIADQGRLLGEIVDVVHHFTDEDWNDYANLRASFVYVLSGGDAQVLKPVVKNKTLGEADQSLARGITSFALGQTKAARRHFKDIDPRSLDVSLVGPVALAQASLYLEENQARAIELFDEARLANPHTAIEEAAVRREVPLLLDKGETERAVMLATDYVRRFGKSLYAHKLFRDFAEAAAKRSELDDASVAENLGSSFETTDGEVSSDFFIDMAGEALMRGRLKLAKAAAGEVLKMKEGPAANVEKARLYAAAAEAPSLQAADALKALDQIAADRLSDDDTEIREVAGYIARVVTGTETTSIAQAGASRAQESAAQTQSSVTGNGLGVSRVAGALDAADAALREADLIISGSEK
jgi:chemotaxis protein MotC